MIKRIFVAISIILTVSMFAYIAFDMWQQNNNADQAQFTEISSVSELSTKDYSGTYTSTSFSGTIEMLRQNDKYVLVKLDGSGYIGKEFATVAEPTYFTYDGTTISTDDWSAPLTLTQTAFKDGAYKINNISIKDKEVITADEGTLLRLTKVGDYFTIGNFGGYYLAEARPETGASVVAQTNITDAALWQLTASVDGVRFINKESGLALTSYDKFVTVTQVGSTKSQFVKIGG